MILMTTTFYPVSEWRFRQPFATPKRSLEGVKPIGIGLLLGVVLGFVAACTATKLEGMRLRRAVLSGCAVYGFRQGKLTPTGLRHYWAHTDDRPARAVGQGGGRSDPAVRSMPLARAWLAV
jgi:hypothetical protein